VIPLDRLPPCTPAVVVSLPRARGLAIRLIRLGLTVGAEVQVLQNWRIGPVIVEVHGARLALGRGQAARVGVDPVAQRECAGQDLAGTGATDI
jgi:ferrous iron transport protein A